jgi:sensor histidine kinase YesM
MHGLVAATLYLTFGTLTAESGSSFLAFLVWTPFGILFYGATASVGFALEYYHRLRERELHASRVETLLLESRLGALRMQLQPHFLFNALNTVAMLVRQGDQQTSVRVLARLSDLLREILNEERGAEVSLQDELEFVRRYLEIEQIRFGDRLRVEIDADDRAKIARVPGLLLQPLIENSIRHAIARKAAAGWIRLEAAAVNGTLQVTLSDDGPGFPPGFRIDQNNGIGLRNTLARLQYLYGDAASMETGQSQHGGAVVRITIPIRAEERA